MKFEHIDEIDAMKSALKIINEIILKTKNEPSVRYEAELVKKKLNGLNKEQLIDYLKQATIDYYR